ncbi:hypothetical protein [Mesorhizobium sp. WSM3860]|uniref:hypothetical protein n=1 Tax=Mesorhizobium sp. WSM3860 TaxID=2029403 RepID=UPI00114108ED|nr:hypothetical protein [Mesorhizobium sp. WSM3860]
MLDRDELTAIEPARDVEALGKRSTLAKSPRGASDEKMAQTIRFAIFAASAALAGLSFSVLHSFWTWAAPLLSFPHGIPADRDTQIPADDDGAFDYPDKCKGSIKLNIPPISLIGIFLPDHGRHNK